jgi:hypothetical protein
MCSIKAIMEWLQIEDILNMGIKICKYETVFFVNPKHVRS